MRTKLLVTAVGGIAATTATASALAATTGIPNMGMGPTTRVVHPAFHGYYDGHKDTYFSTDVSSKAEAAQMHINFAPLLAKTPKGATPEMYMVSGTAAAGQLAVFSSEPGESSYSPLWREVTVTWKAGTTPVLLVKDDQINELEKKGELTEHDTGTVLNCPIVKVGR